MTLVCSVCVCVHMCIPFTELVICCYILNVSPIITITVCHCIVIVCARMNGSIRMNGFVCNAACLTKDGGTGLGSSGSLVKLLTVTHQQMWSFTSHDAD